jgi:hypothetical protein
VFVVSAIGVFQTKVYKLVAVIVLTGLKSEVGSLRKLSQFYITEVSVLCIETVNSFFHLYGCGYPHNRIDEVSWLQVPRM